MGTEKKGHPPHSRSHVRTSRIFKMFRLALRVSSSLKQASSQSLKNGIAGVSSIRQSSGKVETDEEFDKRYVDYFNRTDIDNWEIRKAMNDLTGEDLIPEPKIIV